MKIRVQTLLNQTVIFKFLSELQIIKQWKNFLNDVETSQ